MSLLQSRASYKTGRRIVIDLQKAERALKDGHHKDVELLCAAVLEERSDSAQACQVMAELRFRQDRIDECLAWLERARHVEPKNPRSLNLLGCVLDLRGDLEAAEDAFRQAVDAAPEYPDALGNLGHLLLRAGRVTEAEGYFRRAILFDRDHGRSNLSLGAILYAQGLPAEAVPYLQAGIQRELTDRTGQYTLAAALRELGRLDEAITAYRRLVAAGDEDPDVFSGLATVLEAMSELEIATAGYESALELAPDHSEAAAGLARIMTATGKPAAALDLLTSHVDRGDSPACLHIARAGALQVAGRRDEALLCLADLVKRPGPVEDLVPAHVMLGDLLDLRGDYALAFAQYRQARKLRQRRYDAAAQEDFVRRMITSFTRETMQHMPRGSRSRSPVFVIGMPRAGGAMLERLIAAHPMASGAGALPHVDLGAGRIGRYNNAGLSYPECATVMRERDLRELSAAYLAHLLGRGDGGRRIVDSKWLNYLHVGLIELMFPQARLVHCYRAPVDAGLGCYFNAQPEFGEPFTGELADVGHFYGQYRRLMDHWRATTTLPMLELDFDALLLDPETEARRLIDFLGLPWDPACLALAEHVAGTGAGIPQPPLPGMTSGWSRNYEKFLDPLRAGLNAAGYPAA